MHSDADVVGGWAAPTHTQLSEKWQGWEEDAGGTDTLYASGSFFSAFY